jgi:hypothetical protein
VHALLHPSSRPHHHAPRNEQDLHRSRPTPPNMCWTKSSASCTMPPHSLTIRLCSTSQKCTSYSKWMHLTSHDPNPDPSLGASPTLATSATPPRRTEWYMPSALSSMSLSHQLAKPSTAPRSSTLSTVSGFARLPTRWVISSLPLLSIGLATDTIKQRRSKSIDMRFHWLRD